MLASRMRVNVLLHFHWHIRRQVPTNNNSYSRRVTASHTDLISVDWNINDYFIADIAEKANLARFGVGGDHCPDTRCAQVSLTTQMPKHSVNLIYFL